MLLLYNKDTYFYANQKRDLVYIYRLLSVLIYVYLLDIQHVDIVKNA